MCAIKYVRFFDVCYVVAQTPRAERTIRIERRLGELVVRLYVHEQCNQWDGR